MYLLALVFIGVLVGWAAGRILEGNGYGPWMDAVMVNWRRRCRWAPDALRGFSRLHRNRSYFHGCGGRSSSSYHGSWIRERAQDLRSSVVKATARAAPDSDQGPWEFAGDKNERKRSAVPRCVLLPYFWWGRCFAHRTCLSTGVFPLA